MDKYDAIVVGGGMAGLTATAYLAREGKSVMLCERMSYFGGLVNSFERNGVFFDGGIRSIENSGIVFPMLQELGIEVPFVNSQVSLVIENSVLRLDGTQSIDQYHVFLKEQFPEEINAIDNIIREIKKITGYMDVMYGVDNPMFKDLKKDRKYLFKTLLPWLFKFLLTMRKIEQLNVPVYTFLSRFTDNMALIDNIAQHFFKKTPTSFALSYFSLYNDYKYPVGGTHQLPLAMEKYTVENGAVLKPNTTITEVNPEEKWVLDDQGTKYYYESLVWACDLKTLYNSVYPSNLSDPKLKSKIFNRKEELKELKGAESVFTVYLSVNKKPEYFNNIASGHVFFTPDKSGLSTVDESWKDKETLFDYLRELVKKNTLEISIPALRDPSLAPKGVTSLVVSILFEYSLNKRIYEKGWEDEFKVFMEELILKEMVKLYPEIAGNILDRFSSTPMTMERYTANTQGAIVGWSFENPYIPVVSKLRNVAKSVNTPVRDIYKAGQWSYSPAGVPISILTGKLAANKVLKKKR